MLFNMTTQAEVLEQALKIAGYADIANAALQAIDSDPNTPAESKAAIRAMAYWMPNNIVLNAGDILHTIATAPWELIGITSAPALEASHREAIIGVIMAVSKSVIGFEVARLEAIADADTSLPEGWANPPEPAPVPEN